MTIRKILTEPDPFLRQVSQDVDKVDDEIRKLMDDMLETMYAAPGIGLAAIQVGVPKRVIVIDLSKEGSHWIVEICKTLNTRNDLWFSEYQFYANYSLKIGKAKEHEIKVFRRFDIIGEKFEHGFNNYAVLAHESQHKTGFFRKIRARLFYFLKLNLG